MEESTPEEEPMEEEPMEEEPVEEEPMEEEPVEEPPMEEAPMGAGLDHTRSHLTSTSTAVTWSLKPNHDARCAALDTPALSTGTSVHCDETVRGRETRQRV